MARLPAIAKAIDAVRAEHVAHWLEVEKPRFAKLRKELNSNTAQQAALLQIDTQTPIALAALEQARDVALPEDRSRIYARATQRGETLEAEGHIRAAEQFYRFAQLDARADALAQQADAEQERRSDEVIAELEKAKDQFLKTDAEQAEYEEGTDALADELGIDLDDF